MGVSHNDVIDAILATTPIVSHSNDGFSEAEFGRAPIFSTGISRSILVKSSETDNGCRSQSAKDTISHNVKALSLRTIARLNRDILLI